MFTYAFHGLVVNRLTIGNNNTTPQGMLLPLLGAGVHSQFLAGWGDERSLIIPFSHGVGGTKGKLWL